MKKDKVLMQLWIKKTARAELKKMAEEENRTVNKHCAFILEKLAEGKNG